MSFGREPISTLVRLSGANHTSFSATAPTSSRWHGPWTAELEYFTAAPVWDGTSSLAGTGDQVYLVYPQLSELTRSDVAYLGTGNFIVRALTAQETRLLVNEIGDYSDEVLLPAGLAVIAIVADEDWRFDPQ
jgi:hypothetical protein